MDSTTRLVVHRIRRICLSLPDATETISPGENAYRVAKKTFCLVKLDGNELFLVFKVGRPQQRLYLSDPRFCRAAYRARYGWVSLLLSAAAKINWPEVRELVEGSYREMAPKRARRSDALP
jgi:predicted DNA-binding protein (MmcQ/YjbR family)